jgi:hypothetical protein
MRGKGYGEMALPMWDKRMWDDDGSWLQAPTLRTVTDIAVTAAIGVATGGVGAIIGNAAMGLIDDAAFALLDGALGYKGWDQAGVEFGKKAAVTAVTTGLNIGFGGMNASIGGMTAGLDKTIAQAAGGFMQGTLTNLTTSAISSITYSADGGFGFDTKAFGQSLQAGLVGSLVQGAQTAASGLINIGIEGLTGNALANTSKMSNFIGGLAGQGVNAALGGAFTLNVLNMGFLAGEGNTALNRLLSTGLLEMRLGGESGFGMNIGTGGVDASIGNLMAVGRGIGTYIDVNSRLAGSRQAATGEFASAMRTWYSGTEEQRRSFDDALSNRLLFAKSAEKDFADPDGPAGRALAQTKDNGDGTRTMYIGTAAMELDSRFGLNVVFGHEAYRDGIDNGIEGQRLETDRAVEGHINTAIALMAGYGAGSVGDLFAFEALVYDNARKTGNTEVMDRIRNQYDSSADFWKLTNRGELINDEYARVVDEAGNVIISLEDLGMDPKTQSRDCIASLARMLGVSNAKAVEIMNVNSGEIQLGTGNGIGGNDYADALRYMLTAEGMGNVTGMTDEKFEKMTTDKRADYLKRQYIVGSTFIGEDKGGVAAQLRGLDGLHRDNILGDLFYMSYLTPDDNAPEPYVPAENYDFMNEPLREFLNLKLDGSSQYESISEILTQGFKEMDYLGSLYHLDPAYTDVKKYVHTDGREVIWGMNKDTDNYEQINSELYRGTYNYGEGKLENLLFRGTGTHYYFDMRPFDVQHNYNLFTPSDIEKAYKAADAEYKAKKRVN